MKHFNKNYQSPLNSTINTRESARYAPEFMTPEIETEQ